MDVCSKLERYTGIKENLANEAPKMEPLHAKEQTQLHTYWLSLPR